MSARRVKALRRLFAECLGRPALRAKRRGEGRRVWLGEAEQRCEVRVLKRLWRRHLAKGGRKAADLKPEILAMGGLLKRRKVRAANIPKPQRSSRKRKPIQPSKGMPSTP